MESAKVYSEYCNGILFFRLCGTRFYYIITIFFYNTNAYEIY